MNLTTGMHNKRLLIPGRVEGEIDRHQEKAVDLAAKGQEDQDLEIKETEEIEAEEVAEEVTAVEAVTSDVTAMIQEEAAAQIRENKNRILEVNPILITSFHIWTSH